MLLYKYTSCILHNIVSYECQESSTMWGLILVPAIN